TGTVKQWPGGQQARSDTIALRDLFPQAENLRKILPRAAHIASASNAVGDEQTRMIHSFIPCVDVGVPQSGNQESACRVDSTNAQWNSQFVGGTHRGDAISRNQDSLVWFGGRSR